MTFCSLVEICSSKTFYKTLHFSLMTNKKVDNNTEADPHRNFARKLLLGKHSKREWKFSAVELPSITGRILLSKVGKKNCFRLDTRWTCPVHYSNRRILLKKVGQELFSYWWYWVNPLSTLFPAIYPLVNNPR